MRVRLGFAAILIGLLVLPGAPAGAAGAAAAEGWEAAYWNNMELSGQPALTRSEPSLSHDWRGGSPAAGVRDDEFSARWQRRVDLAAGTYRFTASSDDGIRVWVDGVLILDEWQESAGKPHSVRHTVAGGSHLVVVEYYDFLNDAKISLSWAPAEQVVAQNWRGEYYANRNLSGTPARVRDDAQIQFDWGQGAPAAGLPADRFSARWTRTLNLAAGRYRFTATADDGVRLWIDNRLLIDAWRDQGATTYWAEVQVPGGGVPVKLEYYENLGDAVARLSWAAASTVQNWRGEYYANRDLAGWPALVREDAEIRFHWGAGAPAAGLPRDYFSARWTANLPLEAGTYRFTVTGDDGVRLWVDNRLLVDAWRDQAATAYSGEIALPGGTVPVRLEYYEAGGEAVVNLSWVRR